MKTLRLGLDQVPLQERAAPVLIVLLAFALRVYRLGAQPIWWDESLSVYRATQNLAAVLANTIRIQTVVTYDTLPPLYFVILKFLVPFFGTTEFALRFFSLAANVATIPLLYVLARRWCRLLPRPVGARTALVAALLGALSPFYVWYAQEARPYTLVLFWSTLAIYALTRAFTASPARQTVSRAWIVIYVAAAAAALYTHYYSIFLLPFHILLIAALTWRAKRAWILLPAIPVAAASPLVPLILASMAGNAGSGPYFVPLDIILRDLLNSFSAGITVDLAQVMWIDVVMLVLFLIGIGVPGWISRSNLQPLLLAYILVPALGVFAASYIRPLYQNSRYLISISPAFYIGVSAGIAALAQRWKIVAIPAFAVFLVGAVLSLGNLYYSPRFGKDDHRAWAESLRERVQPGDLLILNSPHAEELYLYYAGDLLPWKSLPILKEDRTASPEADLAAVKEAFRSSPRVWYLQMDVPFDDPERRIEKLLSQEGILLDRMEAPATSTEISLSLFVPALPSVDAAKIANPLNVAFAGNLRLRGYDAPPSVQPGRRSAVRLYWQIDEPVGEDYAVSLRMVASAAGAIVSQWDSVPLGNRAGSSTWRPNMILMDLHDLPVDAATPQGKYDLQVVPYHAATGTALGEPVTLGEIRVERPTGSASNSDRILLAGVKVQ
ncbi:MAG TPA: glycosyltransferase family 39 protein [Anaerolineae bacterium]